MKKNLTAINTQEHLQKKINSLSKINKKLKGYRGLVKDLGDNPDEIKLKLNQIVDLDSRK